KSIDIKLSSKVQPRLVGNKSKPANALFRRLIYRLKAHTGEHGLPHHVSTFKASRRKKPSFVSDVVSTLTPRFIQSQSLCAQKTKRSKGSKAARRSESTAKAQQKRTGGFN